MKTSFVLLIFTFFILAACSDDDENEKKYKIVTSTILKQGSYKADGKNDTSLEVKINWEIDKGWSPIGGVFKFTEYDRNGSRTYQKYGQGMIKD